ncbi:hypothetical protein L7F22_006133 [Adiantum nelumboides]|nr:hypothetical protein [Adiantum nelumboides]
MIVVVNGRRLVGLREKIRPRRTWEAAVTVPAQAAVLRRFSDARPGSRIWCGAHGSALAAAKARDFVLAFMNQAEPDFTHRLNFPEDGPRLRHLVQMLVGPHRSYPRRTISRLARMVGELEDLQLQPQQQHQRQRSQNVQHQYHDPEQQQQQQPPSLNGEPFYIFL